MKTALALLASAPLWIGCVPRQAVLPDPSLPHRIAKEVDVVIWVRLPDGAFEKKKVHADEGWWLASPQVVEGTP